MGDWYTIGLAAGLGAAVGVLAVALLSGRRAGVAAAAIVAVAVGIGLGFVVENWDEALAGALGALGGVLGSAPIVSGALRRGGTRGGTTTIVAGVALVIAALAFVPILGYLLAVAIPAFAARLRRRQPERYAGLRTLAK